MELEPKLKDYGVEFTEDDTLDHAEGDMGIFTIGVPVTIAVVKLVETWIKSRTPLTEITVTAETGSATVKTKGHNMDPADVDRFLGVLKSAAE